MGQIWENARAVIGRGLKQADAQVNGTPRARALYAQLGETERKTMAGIVRERFGEKAWDDFVSTVDRKQGGKNDGTI